MFDCLQICTYFANFLAKQEKSGGGGFIAYCKVVHVSSYYWGHHHLLRLLLMHIPQHNPAHKYCTNQILNGKLNFCSQY